MRAYSLILFLTFFSISFTKIYAQSYRWQQRVAYTIEVSLDVQTHKIKGNQTLIYYNHSPDTLRHVYYHLYFNAFQPGSMMDVRSRTIADPDPRVADRIYHLKKNEIGYQKIISMQQEGINLEHTSYGTLLEVKLHKPLLPNTHTQLAMIFEGQVPLQIRRTGRDNKEGIAYSMTQWYPKMAEYDYQGWHAYPYIGREFYGVWGDYDVSITLNSKYTVAGTGELQNASEVGHGYANKIVEQKQKKSNPTKKDDFLTWHFKAKDVHDFAWAADSDYVHTIAQVPNGPTLHFFYQPEESTTDNWEQLKGYAIRHFQYMNQTYGRYPYTTYSIIQGGDGGMEYPMCTLITGKRSLKSLVGVMVHEATHSWYHGALASNEGLYPWMDEGFTTFVSTESMSLLFETKNNENIHKSSYDNYFELIKRKKQEPLSQHADHYNSNIAYGIGSYSMGDIFLDQLDYIVGRESFIRGMKRYYNTWKMRHPDPNDFIREMEKESGMQLHWYLRYWIYTTKHIDYGIDTVYQMDRKTRIKLARVGDFPMPIDLTITYKDGGQQQYHIPLSETMAHKQHKSTEQVTVLKTWNWVNPSYTFSVQQSPDDIENIIIDPSARIADKNRKNNVWAKNKE